MCGLVSQRYEKLAGGFRTGDFTAQALNEFYVMIALWYGIYGKQNVYA